MIPPDGVKWELDGMVDSVPPDKGCQVLDRDLSFEYWDDSNSENFADGDDAHILLKWRGHYNML